MRFCSDKWAKQREKEFVEQLGFLILSKFRPWEILFTSESHSTYIKTSKFTRRQNRHQMLLRSLLLADYKPVWITDASLNECAITNQKKCMCIGMLCHMSACVCVQRGEYQNTLLLSLAVRCITQTFSILSARAASTLAPSKLSRHFIKWLQTLGRVSGKSLY